MSLTFEQVDKIFKEYELMPHMLEDGKRTEYSFQYKKSHTGKLSGRKAGNIFIAHTLAEIYGFLAPVVPAKCLRDFHLQQCRYHFLFLPQKSQSEPE